MGASHYLNKFLYYVKGLCEDIRQLFHIIPVDFNACELAQGLNLYDYPFLALVAQELSPDACEGPVHHLNDLAFYEASRGAADDVTAGACDDLKGFYVA